MTARRLRFDQRAVEEFIAAVDWYEDRLAGLGREFINAVDRAVERLVENPGLGGPVPGVDPELGTRRLLLQKFPYSVVYLESGMEITVVAVAHGHRRPGYWRDRLARE
jgi:toxin ParE1/3/4